MKNLLFFVVLSIFLGSCTLEESYNFNSEWGGRYESVFDITGVASFGEDGEAEPDEPISQEKKDELIRTMNSHPGISNASVSQDVDKHTLTFGYRFENLEALNSLNQKGVLEKEHSPVRSLGQWQMSTKGLNKFFMTMEPYPPSEMDNEKETQEMGEMLQITTKLNFHKPIKSISSDVAIQGTKKNQLVITYSMADLWDQDKNWDVKVKF